MINRLKTWFHRRDLYVICDPNDNSVTISKALFKHMGVMNLDVAKVYVFFVPDTECYGFILNPDFDQETQLAEVQYNDKFKTVGFECLVPTVNRIFYDYGLPHDKRVKLSAQVKQSGELTYYMICRPKQ